MVGPDARQALRIAVLFGGKSQQRELSFASGICAAAALESAGHRVRAIDPSETELADVEWRQFDAAFLALHGPLGEDGRVQQLLEAHGVAYTGSGPAASQTAASKHACKTRLIELGIPTPRFEVLHISQSLREMTGRAEAIGYPLVVKPDAQSASLGIGLVHGADKFALAVTHGQFYDRFLLAERYVPGREFSVAVLGREALPPLEILVEDDLLTWAGKFDQPRVECTFETGLSARKLQELKQTACRTANALGAEGLVQVDLRMDPDGALWVLEVNTSAYLGEDGYAARAARQAGLDMATLCERLVAECLGGKAVS